MVAVRVGLMEKMTFMQRLKKAKEGPRQIPGGRAFQAERLAKEGPIGKNVSGLFVSSLSGRTRGRRRRRVRLERSERVGGEAKDRMCAEDCQVSGFHSV